MDRENGKHPAGGTPKKSRPKKPKKPSRLTRQQKLLIAVAVVLAIVLIAVVAFPLAYLSSKQVAGTLGTLFGKAAENVIVTPEHFMRWLSWVASYWWRQCWCPASPLCG